ncbi:hypothetical protein NC651_023409 [Populus alba x Populus x berolinensis]|nr:hypothetical protein NC651_023409 [Populus alba x Populus x berolinensis]
MIVCSSYGLDDEKFENEHLHSNTSDLGQIARAVYDVEEATAFAVEIILQHKMIKQHTRVSLIKFLQLLAVHHPSKRCRKGSAEVLVNFDDLCPPDMWSPDKQEVVSNGKGMLGNFRFVGKKFLEDIGCFAVAARMIPGASAVVFGSTAFTLCED